jgi:hypothetical protein
VKKKLSAAVEMGRRGGKARAKKLSAEEQSRIAKKAVAAREAKRAAKKEAKG